MEESDDVEQAEYSRMKCDPAIGVSDLEKALTNYFQGVAYRNLQEVIDIITDAKCSWKSAPKARAGSCMSLGFFLSLGLFRSYAYA